MNTNKSNILKGVVFTIALVASGASSAWHGDRGDYDRGYYGGGGFGISVPGINVNVGPGYQYAPACRTVCNYDQWGNPYRCNRYCD